MKKSTKIALITAISLVAAGCLLGAAAYGLGGSFERELHEVTHTADEPFTDISVSVSEADVHILPSKDGSCYAVCEETDRVRYGLAVTDGTLTLALVDNRHWYDFIGISIGTPTVTLYLPQGAYNRLTAESQSGQIHGSFKTDTGLSFTNVTLKSSSGKISFAGKVKTLTAENTAGDVILTDLTAETIYTKTSSGAILFADIHANETTTEATSGRTHFTRTIVAGTLTAKSSSGNIKFEASDAKDLILTSQSGNITGSLLSDKLFDADSNSGNITCPAPKGDGTCWVRTSSGNISLIVLG